MEGTTMKNCTSCEGAVAEALLSDEIKVAGVRFTGSVPGWRCDGCGEAFYDGPGLREFELAAAAHLLTQGLHTGEVLRFARKALGLKGTEIGEMLGVRPETLSRWETGERPAEPRAVVVLAGLVGDALKGSDETAARLRATRAPGKGPRRVDLDAFREEIRTQLRSTTERMVGTAEKIRVLRVLEVRRSANR